MEAKKQKPKNNDSFRYFIHLWFNCSDFHSQCDLKEVKNLLHNVVLYSQDNIDRLENSSRDAKAGSVLSLGTGDTGQLGLGEDITERTKPALVTGVNGKVMAVAAGGMHTICVTTDGKVWSFGCNDEGALGRAIDEDEEGNNNNQFEVKELRIK